jgi:hypothetical protein
LKLKKQKKIFFEGGVAIFTDPSISKKCHEEISKISVIVRRSGFSVLRRVLQILVPQTACPPCAT